MDLVTSSDPLRGPEPAPGPSDPAVSVVKIRRRLAPGVMRTQRVNVRLSDDELAAVRVAAGLTGLTVTGYLAATGVAVATGTRPPRVVPERVGRVRASLAALTGLRAELRHIGRNVNQLARHANAADELPAGLQDVLDEVGVAVRRVDAVTAQLVDRS